jgi:hypothetical protein
MKLISSIKYTLFFLAVVLLILNISLVSSIYAGETREYEINIGTEDLSWIVINNMSNITPIVNIMNNSFISLTIPSDMPPCNCSMVFLKNDKVVQTIQVSTGSSGSRSSSRTKTIYKNNTEYIEVPNYINNETIKIVENKTTETEWKNVPTPTKWTWIFAGGFLILVIIICVLIVKWSNSIENRELEGGQEEYGRNKEEENNQ